MHSCRHCRERHHWLLGASSWNNAYQDFKMRENAINVNDQAWGYSEPFRLDRTLARASME